MATIKELYQRAINNAFLAADSLIDNKDKAMAYTAIANALAQTGLINDNIEKDDSVETLNKNIPQKITREDLKRKPQPAKITENDIEEENNSETAQRRSS